MIKPVIKHWFDSSECDMDTQYDIVALATVASTQDEARTRFETTETPTLVVADEQFAGRGRQGRDWTQPDRGMFASVALSSEWDLGDRPLIPLVAAVAMRTAVADSFGIEVGLRWPNDLMIDRDKVGGILVEVSGDVVVIGCGVNLWWDNPMEQAASLLEADPGGDAVATLARDWADVLIGHLELGSGRWPRAAYEAASVTLGREVLWGEGRGHAVAIASDGALVVERNEKRIELRAGEVHTHRGR